jgi:two-component system cell cycle sensor histidine kinase/response regulator CckA
VQNKQKFGLFPGEPNSLGGLVQLQAVALEATANAVMITNLTGTVIWVNSAFEQLTGYRHSEIVGQSTRVLKSGQNSQALYEEMWRTILGGGIWRGELINRRKDGSVYDEEMTIAPVQDRKGEITHYIAIKLDISERRRAEEQHYMLAQAVESSSELIAMTDSELRITFVNRALLHALRYSEEKDLIGKNIAAIMSPNNAPELFTEIATRTMESGEWTGECLHMRADRTDFPVLLSTVIIKDQAGCIMGTLGIAQDITDRKKTEGKLRQLAAIVESSHDAIISKTLDGIIQTWNGGAEWMYEYSAAEAIGKPISILFPLEQRDEIPEILEKIKRGEIMWNLETRRTKKDGKQIRIALTVSPIKDGLGRIVGASAIGRDMTESKQMEEMFRQAQKMEAVGRLAGGVAHDFNNLLSVIIGYSEILLDRVGQDVKMRSQCEEIKKAGERAASLTRQLLAFSRQQVLEQKVLNLNTSVGEIEKMLQRLIGEDIELRTSLDPALGSVKADPGQIEQVIMNLVVNARDAMPQGGKLIIETSNVELDEEYAIHHPPITAGRYVLLAVADCGVGMSEETKARIFEPFFTTKELGKGTGLGLATVYGVVKQSGGFIWVYSEPGQGSVFKIYLPRVDGSEEQVRPSKSAPELLRGTETVLLVEVEESVRKLTRSLLEESGYTVLEADNCAQAAEIAKRHHDPIHLLLTDVVMPGMNGPAVADQILPIHSETKVLYVSGYSSSFGSQTGLVPAGANLLQKPFSRAALLRNVRDVLEMQKKSEIT